jgi:hypothetical protein
MNIHTSFGGRRKVAHADSSVIRNLSPLEAYAVRALTLRARISLPHAMLVAELAGLVRENSHG